MLASLRLPLFCLLAQLAACQMNNHVAERPDAGSDVSTDAPASPLGTRWVQSGGPAGGRHQVLGRVIPHVGFGPVLAMVAGERTLLESNDFGRTWSPLPGAPPVPSNTPAVYDTAVMTFEANEVYIGSSAGGALVSHDGGRTFARFDLGLPRGIATRLVLMEGRLYALGVEDDPSNANPGPEAYVSLDGGRTFSSLLHGVRPEGLFVTSREIMLTTFSGELLRSTDGGESWTTVSLPEFDVPTVFAEHFGTLYASGQRLFRSTDRGVSWTSLGDVAVESFAELENHLYAVSAGSVAIVERDGTLTPVGQSIPRTASMGIANAGGALVVGTEVDGIWRLQSGASTWVPVSPASSSVEHLTAFEGGLAAARASSQTVFVSSDRATTWQPHRQGLDADNALLTALSHGPSGLYAGTLGAGVLRSSDGGATWQALASGLNDDGSAQNGMVMAVEEADGRLFVGLAGGTVVVHDSHGVPTGREPSGGGVFVSTDNGASWRLSDTGLPLRTGLRTHPAGITALRPMGDHVVLAATQPDEHTASSLYRSVDDGAHWTRSDGGFAPLPNDRIQHLVRNGGAVYAVTEHRVFRSDDGGVQWVRVGFGLPDTAVIRDVAAGDGFAAVATEGHGVYVSRDQGATGAALVSGLPTVPVLRLAVQGGALYASLRDRGVWRLE